MARHTVLAGVSFTVWATAAGLLLAAGAGAVGLATWASSHGTVMAQILDGSSSTATPGLVASPASTRLFADGPTLAPPAIETPMDGTPADLVTRSGSVSATFHSEDWASSVAGHGCTLIRATASDVLSDGSAKYGGAPIGTVVIPAETLVIQCDPGGVPSFQVATTTAR